MTVVSASTSSAIDALLPSSESNGSCSENSPSFSSVMADQQALGQTPTEKASTTPALRDPPLSQVQSNDDIVADDSVITDESTTAGNSLSEQLLGIAQAVADGWNTVRGSKDSKLKTHGSDEENPLISTTPDQANSQISDYGLLMTALPVQALDKTSSRIFTSADTSASPVISTSIDDLQFDLAAQTQQGQSFGQTSLDLDSTIATQSESAFVTMEPEVAPPLLTPSSYSESEQVTLESEALPAAFTPPSLGINAQSSAPQRATNSQRNTGIELSAERGNRAKATASDSSSLLASGTNVETQTTSAENVFTRLSDSMESSFQESMSNTISPQSQTSSSTSASIFSAAQLGSPQGNPVQTGTLSAPVGSSAWTQQLSDQILQHSQWQGRYALNSLGQQQIELSLNPADLGPLHIVLSVNDGVAQASFTSAHATVRDSVETALPQLQQALANAGLTLGQANVGADQAQSDQQQSASAQGSRSSQPTDIESSDQPVTVQRPQRSNSLLDTFA